MTGSTLAGTPPMGWNSWDCFGVSVTEDEVIANARFMAEHLLEYGWDTVVVDHQWYERNARISDYPETSDPVLDTWGRQMPVATRFPSAADGKGFAPLADRIHALGLKFGVHVMRGIPRKAADLDLPILGAGTTAARIADKGNLCEWNNDNYGLDMSRPGAQEYYDSQVAQLAEWGVDFIKLDDVLWPVQTAEIAGYHAAIEKAGRDIVLSLSPGRRLSLAYAGFFAENAEMWRISDDLWDDWSALREMFQRVARWAPHQRAGAWGDADMLPIGRIGIRAHVGTARDSRLTLDEQRTMMTLWCVARSPLMIGGHLPESPPDSVRLFQNRELIDVLQLSSGNRELIRDNDIVVWEARRADTGTEYRAIFWLGDEPVQPLRLFTAELGLSDVSTARDVWTGEKVKTVDGDLELDIPAHGVRLIAFQ
ncbi:glycoside hydrolase family 27 protein [Myceligenerans halotolerans]